MDVSKCFEILGVGHNISLSLLHEEYKRKVKLLHPDAHPGNPEKQRVYEEKLKDVNAAYEVLKRFLEGTEASQTAGTDDRKRGPVRGDFRELWRRIIEMFSKDAGTASDAGRPHRHAFYGPQRPGIQKPPKKNIPAFAQALAEAAGGKHQPTPEMVKRKLALTRWNMMRKLYGKRPGENDSTGVISPVSAVGRVTGRRVR